VLPVKKNEPIYAKKNTEIGEVEKQINDKGKAIMNRSNNADK
jgi:hypothetical protein